MRRKDDGLSSIKRTTSIDFESQRDWNTLRSFFDAWGYPRATFDRIKANDEHSIHNGVYISKQAFIMDTNIRNLYSVLGSLQKNNVVSSDVRFIFVTNESDLLAFDQKTFETLYTYIY